MRVRIIPTLILYIDLIGSANTKYTITLQRGSDLRQYEKPPFCRLIDRLRMEGTNCRLHPLIHTLPF